MTDGISAMFAHARNIELDKKLPKCSHRSVREQLNCHYKWYGSCGYETSKGCFICFFSDALQTKWKDKEGFCILGKPRCVGFSVDDYPKNKCFVPACGLPKIPTKTMLLIINKVRNERKDSC